MNITPSDHSIPLLQSPAEKGIALAFLFALCALSFSLKHHEYKAFLGKKPLELHAQVLLQYAKNGHFVLKLKDSHNNSFYTTNKENIKDLTHHFVRAWGKMGRCSFWQFLRACYFATFKLSLENKSDPTTPWRNFINKQHQSPLMANFYRTLFLADPLDKSLRQLVVGFGVSPLIAISGFHLGILSAFFFYLLSVPYQFLQQRYFPYRNRYFDLMAVVLGLLFGYLILLHFQPAFLRAYIMALVGFGLVYGGLELVSFWILGLSALLCLAMFPNLVRSAGFWLSVSGVFYIFLFLKYMPKTPVWLYALLFNASIFTLMLPLVHFFFTPFGATQLIGILLSFVFVVFFPLVLSLHALHLGGLLDPYLLPLVHTPLHLKSFSTPPWFLCVYVGLSLLAVRFLWVYVALGVASGGLLLYLLIL
ncbi:Competence locus E ComE 3 [Helicobacter sp. NHP21005]|uniref:ComEC/Rec2 family competence protein n=1 Tax=Helicobacter felistomachi TaxID=3040201 RepID=UPI002573EEBB|nr:ComEC/Rec2 family competence protein [Helicobacter sp. NHP21005]BEG57092.1 Competence locus E ComE 3 [Helicobacter sp. NHP21005]